MASEMVVSKNLFNFRPSGRIDPDIFENEKKMLEEAGMTEADVDLTKVAAMSDEDMGKMLKGMMEFYEKNMFVNDILLNEVCTFFGILIYYIQICAINLTI